MRIYTPGFPVQYIDEPDPSTAEAPTEDPLPEVAMAMALAQARQSQVLNYTRTAVDPSPLVVNPQPADPILSGLSPHSLNAKPAVT